MTFPILSRAPNCACSLSPQINVWHGDITAKRVILRRGCLIVIHEDKNDYWALDSVFI